MKQEEGDDSAPPTSLMECGICWEIVHPTCMAEKFPNLSHEGIVNEDLPSSWECPKCCDGGKQGQMKVGCLNVDGGNATDLGVIWPGLG